jgi:hypothetical protein
MRAEPPIRVEAPSTASAMALVAELSAFGTPDLVPLDDGRWEVQLSDTARTPMPHVLRAVQSWLVVWNEPETTVHVADRPRLLASDA